MKVYNKLIAFFAVAAFWGCQDIEPEKGSEIAPTEVIQISSQTAFSPALQTEYINIYTEKSFKIRYVNITSPVKHEFNEFSYTLGGDAVGDQSTVSYSIADFEDPIYQVNEDMDSIVMQNVDLMTYNIQLAVTETEDGNQNLGTMDVVASADTVIVYPFERYLEDAEGNIVGIEYGTPDTVANETPVEFTFNESVAGTVEEVLN
ncbi:hypothetical protein [Flammeovirga agarivorans]|uniref:Uncharacterized protein n=1 Tax=Flammeovirga agarivorans TaxID=2726742 RepID=A0A7X8SNG4_9BACT|nr:hypothetical protein [Flammeovirga agarivorans]NLR93417.1 hypothetical protein [Flammeovirga agarivorans]